MLATVLLLGLLALAAATDVWRHKIYNWTTYPGMLTAVGLNGSGSLAVAAVLTEPGRLQPWGWIGFSSSALGLLICGGVLIVCFLLFRVGGGDVKLIAMMGAFLGPERGLEAMLWTFVFGACMAVIVLVWRVGFWRLAARTFRQVLWTLRLGRWSPLTPEERAQLQPPLFLAPSALIAAAAVQFSLADRLREWMG